MQRFAVSLAGMVLAAAPAAAAEPRFGLPIACAVGETCWVQNYVDHDPSSGVEDYACGGETYDGHDGTDIRVRDTATSADVVAAAAGTVKAVRDGVADKLVSTEADREAVAKIECGNGVVIDHGDGWESQYCHMRNGSVAVKKGDTVGMGGRLGSVGYSGWAAFPHVHLSIRHHGEERDPFNAEAVTGTACGTPQATLWTAAAAAALPYREGSILRAGFASGAVDVTALEDGALPASPPAGDWPALVAYVWAINLKKDDVIRVEIAGPQGFASANEATLDRNKATYMLFAGRKRPAGGWPRGEYRARAEVLSGGKVRLARDWRATID